MQTIKTSSWFSNCSVTTGPQLYIALSRFAIHTVILNRELADFESADWAQDGSTNAIKKTLDELNDYMIIPEDSL